jgi:hypothetical protein
LWRPSGPILVSGACCRSSVVEHSIGNGEVDSSILSGSTIYFNNIKRRLGGLRVSKWRLDAEQSTKWRADTCEIRAVGSRVIVLMQSLVLAVSELSGLI